LPPHELILKTGVPVMLLRNLQPPILCYGTRLCIKTLNKNVLEATVLTGNGKGINVYIPKIPIRLTDLPLKFERLQFPLKLAFAFTINKLQGQSLKCTGVLLEEPCFSHGQLYVACSRGGDSQNFYIYSPKGKTKNIVYQQALL